MNTELPPIIPTEDFWARQVNAQRYAFEGTAFGIPTLITANQPDVLAAARLSEGRYSRAHVTGGKPIQIQIAVGQDAGTPLPDDLPSQLKHTGMGEWIALSADQWGHSFANLDTRTACIFPSKTLATDVRLVSRYFIDHYVLNFALTEWAMLHASCVYDSARQRLIVMVATHNVGKSTTALRLVRAGCAFLADGMALLRVQADRIVVGGYPIGEVKLRDDVLAWFPEYSGDAVRVREQNKTIVDLRAAHAGRVIDSTIVPDAIHLCFIERHAASGTRLAPLDMDAALPILAANTAYWNDSSGLQHNTETLHRLLHTAHLHRLHLGNDPRDLVDAIGSLAE